LQVKLSNKSKATVRATLKEFNELIETIAKIEFKKLSSSFLIEYSELIHIGTQVVHHLCTNSKIEDFNNSYISTAIKWAIRNEVRRRYKWYSLKTKRETNLLNKEEINDIREAVYKTILSIDEMAEAENPTQIKDISKTPEETIVYREISSAIKEAMKKLPQKEHDLIEAKFFKDKKLRELSEDFNISPSRISRIIQSGLNKIRKELDKNSLL
jgi:RNA polymerase sigma factor (sigma-70 family)